MTHNEQGLALLGYLKNVSPQLKPKNVLKVEDKNKKPNRKRQAGTAADKQTAGEVANVLPQ